MGDLLGSDELRDLPGAGRPLPPDPDADAGDEWAARHVLRTAAALPPWAELRRDIGERRARIVTRLRAHQSWLERREALVGRLPAERIVGEVALTREADRRVRAEVASAVGEVNALIRQHNLQVTTTALHLRTVSADELLEIARTRR